MTFDEVMLAFHEQALVQGTKIEAPNWDRVCIGRISKEPIDLTKYGRTGVVVRICEEEFSPEQITLFEDKSYGPLEFSK